VTTDEDRVLRGVWREIKSAIQGLQWDGTGRYGVLAFPCPSGKKARRHFCREIVKT